MSDKKNKKKLMVFKLPNGCSGWVNLYGGKKTIEMDVLIKE